MSLANNCPYCNVFGLQLLSPVSSTIYVLEISSKCEGVASGVVSYTTRKDWAKTWVSFNPEHRKYTEIGCADSEMGGAIDD